MFCLKKNLSATIFFTLFVFQSCVGIKSSIVRRDIEKEFNESTIFKTHFTGFCLYDPEAQKYLARINDDLYFVPASNTKILTAFGCITSLPDSIYSFLYKTAGDSLIIKPTGEPTFLHPKFKNQPSYDFLKGKKVFVQFPANRIAPFGPGWAWDDYPYSFQPELSWFPIYGNSLRIIKDTTLEIVPHFFSDYTDLNVGLKPGDQAYRDRNLNIFRIWMETDTSRFERVIPFVASDELLLSLLSDTLQTPVWPVDGIADTFTTKSPGIALTPVLGDMMKRSDNFLAEQLLIYAATMNGCTSLDEFRTILSKRWLSFMPNEVVWVDGSGLSRYNLVTPRSLVAVLNQTYLIKGLPFIQEIFPAGGVSGTIKNLYKSEGSPYIYAKTGTLSNVHNLSGFLITKSGKVLIFSLMNNNYILPVTDVRKEMERFITSIYEAY